MLKLYKAHRSGNCYKVELFMRMNGIAYETEIVDVLNRANQNERFERVSAFQQVPALQDGDDFVWDSQAILVHLAVRHAPHWMPPAGSIEHSHMHQWLAIAANEIGNSLQPMRLVYLIGTHEAAHHMNVAEDLFDAHGCRRRCDRVLSRMEMRLGESAWLAGAEPTIADIACHAYTSLAHQGQIDLAEFPAVQGWLRRISQLPGFVEMDPA